MTAPSQPLDQRLRPATSAPAVSALFVAAVACVGLLARPWLLPAGEDPTGRLLLLFCVLGAVSAAFPADRLAGGRAVRAPLAASLAVTAVGVSAFAAARLLGGVPAVAFTARAVALNTLAAVAEEALFRRLLYAALRPAGPGVAIAGSAIAFALVHLTVWGAWVLPLDLAAGALLAWQRETTGRWSVPAATHAAANLLAVL